MRWAKHRSDLRRNLHPNGYLQRSWNKYGESVFEFSVLEEVAIQQLEQKEQEWLDKTKSFLRNKGFNLRSISRSNIGIASKARQWEVTDPQNHTQIITNLKQFCIKNGLDNRNMCAVAYKKAKSHKGWKCKKLSKNQDGAGREWTEQDKANRKGFKTNSASSDKAADWRRKIWEITTPDNQVIFTERLPDFCRQYGLNPECLYLVAKGKHTQHRGYRCKQIGRLKNG
jgi:hypothetical protein